MTMTDKTWDIVKAYEVGKPGSLVVVIPKEIRENIGVGKGSKFVVKTDKIGRIIYEPINSGGKP
jgi:AbrB family looped-hinge helix DNA binding protein